MMFCTSAVGDKYTTSHAYPKVKMERYSREDQDRTRSPTQPGIPIATVMTVNENWRGKNDPAERRRIQNRLNQRAFRQRQRAGESPKQYKPRSMSSASQQQDSDDEADSPQSESSSVPSSSAEGRATSETSGERSSSSTTNTQSGRVWDELAQLINRNFMAATVTNAQHIGIDLNALQAGTQLRTPRSTGRQVPATLTPTEAQYQVPHDPIIDTIPHARLRYNIIRAIAGGQMDGADFTRCIRASGSLELLHGSWQRGGVVVWSAPEQVGSWELSEPFIRHWAFLLEGCEDLIAATNSWRSRRGERLFPQSINRSDAV